MRHAKVAANLRAEGAPRAVQLIIAQLPRSIPEAAVLRQVQQAQQRRLALLHKEVLEQRFVVALQDPAVLVYNLLPAPEHLQLSVCHDPQHIGPGDALTPLN